MEDFGLTFILLGIAAIFLIIYLFKVAKAKKFYSEAVGAKTHGNDRLAISIFKKALWKANEKPDMETDILSKLKELYSKHNIVHDFGDYETLIEQFRTLKKKSSHRSLREMGKVQKLKKELIDRMPELS
jgi:alcohol dehydrogenase YqhD (iron-dependent ADH family)